LWASEYNNISSGTIQANAHAAGVNASGTVSPGAMSGQPNNCLILAFMSDSNQGGTTNPTLISANTGAGFALNDADISWSTGSGLPSASQFFVQGTSAPITGSFTLTSGGTETYNVIAFALSSGSQGTSKPAGIHIDRLLFFSVNSLPATWKLQIPGTGNLGFLGTNTDVNGTGAITATDSDSTTWTNRGQSGGPIFLERDNIGSASATRTISLTIAAGGQGSAMSGMRYFDISGAATAPFDKTAFVAGGPGGGTNNQADAPDITPSTANGLVIAILNNGLGPTVGLTSPSGAIFDEPLYEQAQFVGGITTTTLTVASTTWGTISNGQQEISGSGVTVGTTIQSGAGPTYTIRPSQSVTSGTTMVEYAGDGNTTTWGNGCAHIYNANTSALNFTWSIANQPSGAGGGGPAGAIAFKPAPAATGATIAWVT
jgi:hypothetical protein